MRNKISKGQFGGEAEPSPCAHETLASISGALLLGTYCVLIPLLTISQLLVDKLVVYIVQTAVAWEDEIGAGGTR